MTESTHPLPCYECGRYGGTHQPGQPNAWCECECHDDPLDACIRELELAGLIEEVS